MNTRSCPALFISAPGSSHGKTTVTAALARYHREQGRKVRVFKTGPDFLDPMIHERASGHPVYQLDQWLAGAEECKRLVYEAAADADLILIEGVMGLFDGTPNSADLAQLLGIPVLAVIDATGTAQTLGAIAYGLANMRADLPFAGVLANRVGSIRHQEMIAQGMPSQIRSLGSLPRDSNVAFGERHLGLMQAQEIADLDARLSAVASAIAKTELAALPPLVTFTCDELEPISPLLAGVRIGVACDNAFSFLYQANLDTLRALGAELTFFSPLADSALPDVDSLYLPGGYPELHLAALQDNLEMKASLHEHFQQHKPIYAECGGMLYLLESLTAQDGTRGEMVHLLPGDAVMQKRLTGLGYQSVTLPGGVLRAHTFHHSLIETALNPIATGERLYDKTSSGEHVYRAARLTATYLHSYFPSNPAAVAELFLP